MGYINFVEAEYEKALDNLNKALKEQSFMMIFMALSL